MNEEFQKFLIYNTPNEKVRVDVFLQNETLWLTQKAMATLFNVAKSTVSEHLANIFNTEELSKDATVREFRTVQIEGERSVAKIVSDKKAVSKYETFNKTQKIISDFDKQIKNLSKKD